MQVHFDLLTYLAIAVLVASAIGLPIVLKNLMKNSDLNKRKKATVTTNKFDSSKI